MIICRFFTTIKCRAYKRTCYFKNGKSI